MFGAALAEASSAAAARLSDLARRGVGVAGPGRRFGDASSGEPRPAGKPPLFAARLSHMTTDAARDASFYAQVLGATVVATYDADADADVRRSPNNGSWAGGAASAVRSAVVDFRALFAVGYDPSSDPNAAGNGVGGMPVRPPGTSGGTAAYTQLHLVQVCRDKTKGVAGGHACLCPQEQRETQRRIPNTNS